jgi:catechol 2,3-dioxygenase-like lactoylglutathione lyase family enzyme
LYYNDLPTATEFYAKTLGMEMVADYKTSKVFRMTADSYLVLSDVAASMHKAEEPKTVALALLTDQLDEWYTYLKTTNTPFKYEYNLKPNRPHDGFVVIDPEGYLLEFERFNPDVENEDFLPQLNLLKTIVAKTPSQGLGFKATITWLYYKDMVAMERFYQETLGLTRVVDQGWAKVYQSSKSGYIGLVDERRGMHHFTEKKAVNVSFVMSDLEGWFTYAKKNRSLTFGADSTIVTTDPRFHTFFGFDPEGYVFEFDTFLPHQENKQLLEYLTGK